MLGTFSRLPAQRVCVSFSTWVPQWANRGYSKAVMGTTWQHVAALKELSKIHVADLVPPSVFLQLVPIGVGFGDGRPLSSFQRWGV